MNAPARLFKKYPSFEKYLSLEEYPSYPGMTTRSAGRAHHE